MTSRLAMARSISRPGTTRRKSEYHLRIRSSASQHIFHSDNSMRNTERWEHDCTGGFPSGVESALPPHELRLKVGAPIVAMRNVAKGVTNGPILVVTHPGLQLTHIKASVLGQRGGLEKDFLTNLLIDFTHDESKQAYHQAILRRICAVHGARGAGLVPKQATELRGGLRCRAGGSPA